MIPLSLLCLLPFFRVFVYPATSFAAPSQHMAADEIPLRYPAGSYLEEAAFHAWEDVLMVPSTWNGKDHSSSPVAACDSVWASSDMAALALPTSRLALRPSAEAEGTVFGQETWVPDSAEAVSHCLFHSYTADLEQYR